MIAGSGQLTAGPVLGSKRESGFVWVVEGRTRSARCAWTGLWARAGKEQTANAAAPRTANILSVERINAPFLPGSKTEKKWFHTCRASVYVQKVQHSGDCKANPNSAWQHSTRERRIKKLWNMNTTIRVPSC